MKLSYWLTSLVWRLFWLLGLLAFVVLFGVQAWPASAEAPSYVRLIQASPDVGTVDVFVDGNKWLASLGFATLTDYKQLPAGRHNVQIALLGKGPGATAIARTITVQAGLAYTVAAIGTKTTRLALKVYVDDNRMAADRAKVRVYHLAPGIGVVRVASGGKTILSRLAYSHASHYHVVPAGSYTFHVTATEPTTSHLVSATLKANTVTSLFALSTGSMHPQLQFVNAQVKGVPDISRTGSDPDAHRASSQSFPLLVAWIGAVLALGAVGAGVVRSGVGKLACARGLAACCWLVVGQQKRASLSRNGTPCCRWCSKREERLHATRRGKWIGSTNVFARCLFWLFLGGLALRAPLALPACGEQSSPAHTARLVIAAIGVNAPIEPVGVLPDGTMSPPTQDPWNDVGWYDGGPRPGEQGSAVINGHLDRPGGSPAVFWHLKQLHQGDKVIVVDTQGKTLHFHVTRIRFYAPQQAPVQDLFGNTAGRFLNVLTCAGVWRPGEHQTSLRLVVYTSLD